MERERSPRRKQVTRLPVQPSHRLTRKTPVGIVVRDAASLDVTDVAVKMVAPGDNARGLAQPQLQNHRCTPDGRLDDIVESCMQVAQEYQRNNFLDLEVVAREIMRLGGIVRKAAQFIGNRSEVVPGGQLMGLLADNPARPRPTIESQMRQSLQRHGKHLQFRRILKTGSIGEVCLVMLDGKECALKTISNEQLDLFVADFEIFKKGRLFDVDALADLLRVQLVKIAISKILSNVTNPHYEQARMDEFNLVLEEKKMKKAAQVVELIIPGCFVVPQVVEVAGNGDALLMDFIQGFNLIDQIPQGTEQTGKDLLGLFVHGLLGGFLHGDLHPGNILMLEDGRIGLVDWGLTVEVPHEQRELVRQILLHLAHADATDAWFKSAFEQLGVTVRPGFAGARDGSSYKSLADTFDLASNARGKLDFPNLLESTLHFVLPPWMMFWQKATVSFVITLGKLRFSCGMEDHLRTLLRHPVPAFEH